MIVYKADLPMDWDKDFVKSVLQISVMVCSFHIALDFHIKSTFVFQIQDQDPFTDLCISPGIFTMILK